MLPAAQRTPGLVSGFRGLSSLWARIDPRPKEETLVVKPQFPALKLRFCNANLEPIVLPFGIHLSVVKMASGYGHSGVASGDGKRKRSEGLSRGVCGSGSGPGDGQEYPGDPPTTHTPAGWRAGATEDSGFCGVSDETEETALLGVRARVTVEIKHWAGKGHDFNMDVKMLKGMETLTDVEMRKLVAAIVHDLAQLYWKLWNPEHPARRLNIRRVELLIRKHGLADELLIGGGLLDKYVRDNPLARADVVAGSKEFKALKRDIAELALPFLKVLKAAIAKELSRAGRQREDETHILPFVEEDSEIQRLKDKIANLEERLRTAEGGYLISTNLPTSPTTGLLLGTG